MISCFVTLTHFYLYRRNFFLSAMNADIQDMEERIMMEQRLLKEVTEESYSLRQSQNMTQTLWAILHGPYSSTHI